jgi:hypothetical protein
LRILIKFPQIKKFLELFVFFTRMPVFCSYPAVLMEGQSSASCVVREEVSLDFGFI